MTVPVVPLLLVAAVALFLWDRSTMAPAFAGTASGGVAGWTPARRTVEAQIAAVVASQDFPLTMAHALVANAYAESLLNPEAVGDDGHSFGIFQMFDGGTFGHLTPDQRKDVRTATGAMLEEAGRQGLHGGTLAFLTEQIARKVERPANIDAEVSRRLAIARQLYPGE